MTDQTGNVVAECSYDSWGNVKRIAGAGPDSDFLYAGYFYHKPSGLYITAHRLYSPKLGRWLNRDPIDDPTFAMMPQNPESGAPSTAPLEQPGMAQNPNMLAIQNATLDPRLQQAQLLKSMPQSTFAAPIGKPQTNPYTYVANNPLSKRDPSGLDEDWAWCSAYCTLHAKGALSWIICMQDCMRGFPKHCPSSH
jgi:RHS repeat-associated protein